MNTKNAKYEFDSVIQLRQEIVGIFDVMRGKLITLRKIYSELINSHNGDDYIFGIDALHFQNELIEKDYTHLHNSLNSIERRMYCEYYTLYTQIQKYVKNEIDDKRLSETATFKREFIIYKHLETNTKYDIKNISDIYDAIIACTIELETMINNRESILTQDKHHSMLGLNIHALVYREEFSLVMMRARLQMFYDYLHTFSSQHSKYLSRLLLKAKLQMGIVNEDILLKQFNQGTTIADMGLSQFNNNKSPNINYNEEMHIRNYIDYENLPKNGQNELNVIIAAGGGSNHGSDSTNGSINTNRSDRSDTPELDEETGNSQIKYNNNDLFQENNIEKENIEYNNIISTEDTNIIEDASITEDNSITENIIITEHTILDNNEYTDDIQDDDDDVFSILDNSLNPLFINIEN